MAVNNPDPNATEPKTFTMPFGGGSIEPTKVDVQL